MPNNEEVSKSIIEQATDLLKQSWETNKLKFILIAVPVILAILVVFFRNIIIDILIKNTKTIFREAQTKDADLAKQQTELNAKADQIVEDAKKLDENKAPVTEDWYKK